MGIKEPPLTLTTNHNSAEGLRLKAEGKTVIFSGSIGSLPSRGVFQYRELNHYYIRVLIRTLSINMLTMSGHQANRSGVIILKFSDIPTAC
jgi:hypothetical protein